MQEHWALWEPIEGLENKYNIKNLHRSLNNVTVTLSAYNNKEHEVEFIFESSSTAYRQTNDHDRIALIIQKLSQHYGNNFHRHWSFFKITNSTYLAWLEKESCTWSTYCGFEHFCLLCENSVVDILARCEPKVRAYSHIPGSLNL